MLLTLLFLCLVLNFSHSKTINVSTTKELQNSLMTANAGDVIQLSDAKYSGTFETSRNGTKSSPITLQGSENAVLTNSNYGLYLNNANYWILRGFTVDKAKKGIVLDSSSNNILDNLVVKNIEDEGIHFRMCSSDNLLSNSTVSYTGLVQPNFGEGLYFGSAVGNWRLYACAESGYDESMRNRAIGNYFGPNVAAEAIDIKEGTCCGLIKDNYFDGTGMKGENSGDSWMEIKGDNYLIESNVGNYSLTDGFQVKRITRAEVGACGNVFRDNKCYGIESKYKCVDIQSNLTEVCSQNLNKIIS